MNNSHIATVVNSKYEPEQIYRSGDRSLRTPLCRFFSAGRYFYRGEPAMLQQILLKSLNALFGECVIPALVKIGLDFFREYLRERFG